LGAIAGAFWVFMGLSFSNGAPQEAAAAAMALAFTVIPYALFRVVQLYEARNEEREYRKHVLRRLEALERQGAARLN